MKTSTLLGIFTGLALVNPFAAGLQAMAMSYPGQDNGGTETCYLRAPDGRTDTITARVNYNGPGGKITIDDLTLTPAGPRYYTTQDGFRMMMEPSMDHLVLSGGGLKITCTLNSQGF